MIAAAYALDQCDDCPECAAHAAELRGAIEMIDEWIVAIEQKKSPQAGLGLGGLKPTGLRHLRKR